MDQIDPAIQQTSYSELVPFDKWLKSIGRARVTGWNWRKSGAVTAINVFGRVYITRAEIARFEARAANGEFAGEIRAVRVRRKSKRKIVGFIDRFIGRG